MNLDELRAVQVEERKTDSLQPLRESFYADVADFIAELRDERERAAAGVDDPFAAGEVRELSDEIETAEEVVEAIYERRVGKVVKRASLAAAGIPADEEGLTAEEVDLFESLVADIEENRRTVLDVLAGDHADRDGDNDAGSAGGSNRPAAGTDSGTDEVASAPEPPPEEAVFDAANAVGGDGDPAGKARSSPEATHPEADAELPASDHATTTDDTPEPAPEASSSGGTSGNPPDASSSGGTSGNPPDASSSGGTSGNPPDGDETDIDRISVRITQDIGEILGIDDHTYTLAENDVVMLPTANAEPLIDRDAAERID